LYGPPGTGKTLLPGVCAKSLCCPILNLRLTDVVRGEIGTGERAVVDLFNSAKRSAPCIIFIDEFQAVFTARTGGSSVGASLSSALAGCFDDIQIWNSSAGAESIITVVASTNEPWAVDRTFLRPGRLNYVILVGKSVYDYDCLLITTTVILRLTSIALLCYNIAQILTSDFTLTNSTT
jgi:ATP-dependent 26S proteasome regulatory subunit